MKSQSTSSLHRPTTLTTLQTETFDLLVIGGGATGTGIALDAASRGLKTALVEKRDFASGTSSKSTKLIHGGLRYLQQLDIGLVRETGTERAIVHRLAPHVVLPEKMLMPIVEGGKYGYWMASFGLKVYDILANVEGDDRRKMLNKEESLAKEPLLGADNLKGGVFYAEYRTDDARLTIELIKTAVRHGALAANYCKVVDFTYADGQVTGAVVQDELTGDQFEIKAKKVVAAGGPWVDKLRKKDDSLKGKRLHLTKGVHIVVPHEKFSLKHTVYFDVPDGRMIFAIPRGRTTYIGTTDTTYKADLNRVVATKADAEYIMNSVNSIFPNINLTFDDLESNWAGLRPLIHEDGKSPSELSRKDEIFVSPRGLIAIAGGKLTGYRKMAQRIVDLVLKEFSKTEKRAFQACRTKDIFLNEDPLANSKAVYTYIAELENRAIQLGLKKYYGWYLATAYGKQAEAILDKMNEFTDNTPDVALARAEVWFTVHHEMVNRAADFFVRRTGRLYFDIVSIDDIQEAVFADLQQYLGWSEKRLKQEVGDMANLLFDATNYYEEELAPPLAVEGALIA
ncbi:MAG: glycerol-3-phosphate dehydrogenase/oxidase [Bacteroidota bacterium]